MAKLSVCHENFMSLVANPWVLSAFPVSKPQQPGPAWTWKPLGQFPCICKHIFGWESPLHKSQAVLGDGDLRNQFYPFCPHFFTLFPLLTAGLNQEHLDTSEHSSPEITIQKWAPVSTHFLDAPHPPFPKPTSIMLFACSLGKPICCIFLRCVCWLWSLFYGRGWVKSVPSTQIDLRAPDLLQFISLPV